MRYLAEQSWATDGTKSEKLRVSAETRDWHITCNLTNRVYFPDFPVSIAALFNKQQNKLKSQNMIWEARNGKI